MTLLVRARHGVPLCENIIILIANTFNMPNIILANTFGYNDFSHRRHRIDPRRPFRQGVEGQKDIEKVNYEK
jgi:hypothetical protein